jgi:hypothetical protein
VALEEREREKEISVKAKKSKTVTASPAAQKLGPTLPANVPEESEKYQEKIPESPPEKKIPTKNQSTLFDGF